MFTNRFVGFNAVRSFLESVDGAAAAACNELTSEAAGCDERGGKPDEEVWICASTG